MSRRSIATLLLIATGLIAAMFVITSSQAETAPSAATDPYAGTIIEKSDSLRAFAEAIGYIAPGATGPPVVADAPSPPLRGDLNHDAKIDSADFDLFRNCQNDESGKTLGNCTDSQKAAADLNQDGTVDMKDFRRLLKHDHVAKQTQGSTP